ncbi:MAG: 2-isopropylmalate synthase [Nitrospinota bacterium]
MAAEQVYIFDTTLRDGEQSPGASMDLNEKLEFALQLEKLGVDVIEAGFPVASGGEFEAVREVARHVKDSQVCALTRTKKIDIDRAWEAIKDAAEPRIHTFIATSDIHLEHKLQMTREQVVQEAVAGVKYALKFCPNVEFSPEDSSRTALDFLCEVIRAAIEAGAKVVNVPDTTGYSIPEETAQRWGYIFERVPAREGVIFSAHCHDDLGLAVANSLAAVQAGVRQVECTINGIGERAGNASLEEIAMAIKTRSDFLPFYTRVRTEEIYKTSRLLSSVTGLSIPRNKAIVGKNAFAHEAGIHQHGVIQKALTYEIMTPESVGRHDSTLVLGKHSGRHGIRQRYQELGYSLTDEQIAELYPRFLEVADKKKEVFDEDLMAILDDELRLHAERFRLEYLHVTTGNQVVPTATVKLRDGERVLMETDNGDGPVDAVFKAIAKITQVPVSVSDYSVQSVTRGKEALGEAFVKIDVGGKVITGKGASTDIIEASAKAYLNALNKHLASL